LSSRRIAHARITKGLRVYATESLLIYELKSYHNLPRGGNEGEVLYKVKHNLVEEKIETIDIDLSAQREEFFSTYSGEITSSNTRAEKGEIPWETR